MRAALLDRYSRPASLRIAHRPDPMPGPGQIRIAVRAAAVNPRDWLLCEGKYVFRHVVFGFPKIPGSDVAGVVDAVGMGVSNFKLGDEVVAMQTPLGQMGGFAERFVVNADAVGRKSKHMGFDAAAGLPVAGLTALQMLRDDGALKSGQTVAIIGASGGVGHYAVQIARQMGAHVIAVASAPNRDFVLELGAHRMVDRAEGDVVSAIGKVNVVIDAFGRGSLDTYRNALLPGGRYVTTVPNQRNTIDALATRFGRANRLQSRTTICKASGRDLNFLADLADAKVLRTHIGAIFPLASVNEALAMSRTFGVKGKLILNTD